MTSPLTRNTIMAIKAESTEGTYEAPASTDAVVLASFPTLSPEIERIERTTIRNSIGVEQPINGRHRGTAQFQLEMRAAGATAGVPDEPEADELLLSAFGSRTTAGSSDTTTGSTSSVIELESGEGANFAAGDCVRIDGEIRFVQSMSTDTMTLNRALDKGAPGSGEAVVRGYTYKPAKTGHNPLSITSYLEGAGGTIIRRLIGARVSNLSLADFVTGQIPKLDVTCEIMDFADVTGSTLNATLETQLPPTALGGDIYKDTTSFCINNLGLEMAQEVTREECINVAGGTQSMFITRRKITGTVDPFVDDTSVQPYTDWNANTAFALQIAVGIKDSAGDFTEGTSIAIWLPQASYNSNGFADENGVVKHELGFDAHESNSLNDDIYLGFV